MKSCRVHKFGKISLKYEINEFIGGPLVFVFSAVDPIPGRCQLSYYSFHSNLNATVVHIYDDFGAHGCYLASINKDTSIQEAALDLMQTLIINLNISLDDCYFVGTSKGATQALMFGLAIGGGHIIGGEPQIKIGDFLFQDNWKDSSDRSSIAYVMCGRLLEEDKEYLNVLLDYFITKYAAKFLGDITVQFGEKTGYERRHVVFLPPLLESTGFNMNKLNLLKQNINNHSDIEAPFQAYIQDKFSK